MSLLAFAPLLFVAPAPGPVQWDEQATLARAPAWEAFLGGEGAGWRARFDERTGLPWRAWGPPIALGPGDVVEGLRRFLDRHPDLLGVAPERLVPGPVGTAGGITYARFDQVVSGLPVRGAGVELRVRDGRLVLFGVLTSPAAERTDTSAGPWAAPDPTQASATLVVLPDGRLAWEITGRRPGEPGLTRWVDAKDGTTIRERSDACTLAGQLGIEHDDRLPDNGLVTSPLAAATVTTELATGTTGSDGTYDVAGTGGEVVLQNEAVTVRPATGSPGRFTLAGGTEAFTAPSATQAELDAWVWMTIARGWGATYGPEVDLPPIVAWVGNEPPCQPYAVVRDDEVYLSSAGTQAGQECSDPARVEDIGVHEWGHVFHYRSVVTGAFDRDISEGVADVIAALNTGDPVIAPAFLANGIALRDISDTYVYPDDVSTDNHVTGLIFAGAMWDLWQAFAADEGETAARDRTSRLLATALRGGPGLLDAWYEVVLADDDDGDLSNGTPHECTILAAFDGHGIGPSAGGGVARLVHEPVATAQDGTPIALVAQVENLAPTCVAVEVASASVRYSLDAGQTWDDVPATLTGDELQASIPGQPAGTVVWYALEATLSDGTTATVPASGTLAPFGLVVGPLDLVRCDDFEADDAGYVPSIAAGDPVDGWAWGEPSGKGGDPTGAFSGTRVWGTDLADDGAYGADGDVALLSSEFAIPDGMRGILQFWRWLSVEDGTYDEARVTVNGEVIWSNPASIEGADAIADRTWAPHAVTLPDDGSRSAVVGWDLVSDGEGQLGGWTLDDVCLWAAPSSLEDTDVEPPRACGCASSGPPQGWALVALAWISRRASRSPAPGPGRSHPGSRRAGGPR